MIGPEAHSPSIPPHHSYIRIKMDCISSSKVVNPSCGFLGPLWDLSYKSPHYLVLVRPTALMLERNTSSIDLGSNACILSILLHALLLGKLSILRRSYISLIYATLVAFLLFFSLACFMCDITSLNSFPLDQLDDYIIFECVE